jgi:hypothetical protein
MASPYNGSPCNHMGQFYHGYGYPAEMYTPYYGLPSWGTQGASAPTTSTGESPAATSASSDQNEPAVEGQTTDGH